MTTPADRPRRGGFLNNLSAALTPPVIEDDDPSKPLVAPRGIIVSTVLSILAGLLFIYMGAMSLTNLNSDLDRAVTAYQEDTAKCKQEFGQSGGSGINGQAKPAENAAQDVKDRAANCNKYTSATVTQEMRDNAKSRTTIISVAFVVLGFAAVSAGWFLRQGAAWARRLLVGVVAVTMIATMFLGVSNLLTLLATVGLVVAVLLSYLGKGGVFFARALARRRAAS